MSKKKVLILDCGCQNFDQGGKLNHYYSDLAMKELEKMGHEVQISLIGGSWEIAAEVEKIQWANVIIVSNPRLVDEYTLAIQEISRRSFCSAGNCRYRRPPSRRSLRWLWYGRHSYR